MNKTNRAKRTVSIYVALGCASVLYDRLVIRRGERNGWLEPFTAFTVVAGVLYTLAGVWAVDRKAAVLAFWAFVCSGAPMIAGDLERYLERVRNGDKALVLLEERHGKRHCEEGTAQDR